MRPGIQTSEFFLTMVTIVASATAAMADIMDPKWAAILTTVSTAAYAISRGFAKKA